jgi:hypothetical protein
MNLDVEPGKEVSGVLSVSMLFISDENSLNFVRKHVVVSQCCPYCDVEYAIGDTVLRFHYQSRFVHITCAARIIVQLSDEIVKYLGNPELYRDRLKLMDGL